MIANSTDDCARTLIEVIPEVMQVIRTEIRRQRGPDLSVLQLRVLAFLDRNPGAPLSAVAEHVGLTLPSMSTQVTGLVERALVNRAVSLADRRYVTLTLTPKGQTILQAALLGAQVSVAQVVARLSMDERATVMQALRLLRFIFSPPETRSETTLAIPNETENKDNGVD